MSMQRVLVAHDFSDAANRAVHFAAQLVKQVGGKLDVVYVMPDLYNGRADELAALPPTTPGETQRYLEFLRQEVERTTKSALEDANVEVHTHALRGDPVLRIEALAEELGVDAVAVGATGKGAVARMLMGSTSQALLRTCKVPVLVVP